ncbi:glycosyl hydrolase family 8, partial [uncultured Cytophaga sp.]|uniref:glycosyl hydrolase family 8 n=1 Tax=uncultured Cytophaga sp. TaxID=160238 RepID=UPI0026376234
MKKRLLSAIVFASIVFASASQAIAQTQSFPANKTYSNGLMPTNKNGQDAVSNYNTWKTNFVEACSNGRYRVKFDDRSQTVSEGIGYGMLLSAYAGDKTLFDGLWNYYKDNRNGNGVMNWKINGCSGAIGQNGATDAEVDAAMALIVADYQWGTSGSINYKTDAKALINAIKNFEVEGGSYVLKPGDQFGGSNLTNASYFAPGYFRAFATYMNDSFWNNVADKSYVVINNNLSANNAVGGLVSDWSTASGSYSSSAGGYANGGRNYSYDAARTPWRIAVDYVWYGNASAKAYSKKSSDFVRVNLGGSQNVKDGYSQNGNNVSSYHNSTFVGAFASAAMGGDNQAHLNNSYSDLNGINDAGSYFNQTLKTLYLFLLTGNFYLPGAAPSTGGGGTVDPPVVVVQKPYGTAPAAIPGKIEAEKYDLGGTLAYNDATSGNDGGAFRNDDVDIEATTDAGGGYNIGYTAAGEWLEYTVNVATAGQYDFAVRVASTSAGKSLHIEMDGVNVTGTIAIPNTGDWQTWQTVTVANKTLSAGTKVMRVVMETDGFNLNYINVSQTATAPTNVAPTVSLTAPANNATYTAPASITISANASDSDGSIAKVEFFNGSTLLATDASAPYSYTWTGVAAGTYNITAKATDNSGAATTSAAVSITVTNPAPTNVAPTVSLTAPANNA